VISQGREALDQSLIDLPKSLVTVKSFGPLPTKEINITRVAGVGANANVSFFNNSIWNMHTSVVARVFSRKTTEGWTLISDTPHIAGIFLNGLRDFIDEITAHGQTVAPVAWEDFPRLYKGRKFHVYDKALKSLITTDVTIEDANCTVFLKKEKDIQSDKLDAIPRMITFPDPRFGLAFGRFIKPIEHSIFVRVDEIFRSKTVMKGLNYKQVGLEIQRKWRRFVNPASVDGDVSRLDSAISKEGMRFTHVIAASYYFGEELQEFLKLCEWQIEYDCKGRAKNGTIAFRSRGLGSGQMNTSLVGVLIVCAILYRYIKDNDLDLEVINCGDDFSVIGEKETVETFIKGASKHFIKYNMVLKMENINHHIEGVNFCQTNPVLIEGVYRMVRTPRTAIIKDGTSIDYLHTNMQFAKWMKAVSSCGIATHGGVPIFQEFYRCYARNANRMSSQFTKRQRRKYGGKVFEVLKSSMHYWGKDMDCNYNSCIPYETRWSFYLAFGIDPVVQLVIEHYYRDLFIDNRNVHNDCYFGDTGLW